MTNSFAEEDQKVLKRAAWMLEALENEINTTTPLVYGCKSREEIYRLKTHFEQAIEDWTKRLPGAGEKGREILMIFIESGERELKEVKNILESIN